MADDASWSSAMTSCTPMLEALASFVQCGNPRKLADEPRRTMGGAPGFAEPPGAAPSAEALLSPAALDRALHGAVVDFLNMSCCGFHNPYAFNLADVFIFAGAAGLILLDGSDNQSA